VANSYKTTGQRPRHTDPHSIPLTTTGVGVWRGQDFSLGSLFKLKTGSHFAASSKILYTLQLCCPDCHDCLVYVYRAPKLIFHIDASRPIYYTMRTTLTRNALILSGRRDYRPGRPRRRYSTFAPPRTHAPPVTNPRQGRCTRQLFSGRGECARGQMLASVSHKYSSSSSSIDGGRCLCL